MGDERDVHTPHTRAMYHPGGGSPFANGDWHGAWRPAAQDYSPQRPSPKPPLHRATQHGRASLRPGAWLLLLVALAMPRAFGAVNLTQPTGGQAVSADKALNSTNGAAFTALGNIVIAEGNNADFSPGTGVTLILTSPEGWRFNAGVGGVSHTSNRNITSSSISVSASTITVTLTVTGSDKSDTLTISGVQVQALDGTNVPGVDYIRRTSDNPGTAVIAGIVEDSTIFAQLYQAAGAARVLAMHTQPAAVATATVPFSPQPKVSVLDQFGNLRTTDTSTSVTAARGLGTASLQGTTTRTAIAGVATFTNLSYNVAEIMDIVFSSGSLTTVTSSPVTVGAGSFTKLQLLAPGETAAPGTAGGKTGSPAAQVAGTPFTVSVNAVDSQWNLVSTVTDTVRITSSDGTATLPADAALANGTRSFPVTLNTAGSRTATATNVSDGTKTSSTSPAITVIANPVTPATGGNAISADTTGGAYTALTGPVYTEGATASVSAGTIVLNAPSGFIFDLGGTAPTVLITRVAGSGGSANNINGVSSGTAVAMTSVTATQLTFTVTSSSASGVRCSLTWQNVRVRPTAGTPLAAGNLWMSGAATLANVTTNSNFGALREIAGAAGKLAIQTQPSSVAVAGVLFTNQPVIEVQDQFGNRRSAANGAADNGRTVTAARSAGGGALQGALDASSADGLVVFTNLLHNVANEITIAFSSAGLTGVESSAITVSPAAADRLVFSTQPGDGDVGALLSPQPVVQSRDPFGNDSTVGLPLNLNLHLTLTQGTGSLLGAATLDLGAAAGNGTATFTNLSVNAAGTNKQLTASADGLMSVLSATFAVAKGDQTLTFDPLADKSYGDAPFTVDAAASSGLAVSFTVESGPATMAGNEVTITGVGAVTLRASQSGNDDWNAAEPVDRSFTVTAKAIVVTGITAADREYDGDTNAALNLDNAELVGVLGSEDVTLNTNAATGAFESAAVGTEKTVTISSLTLDGADAGNYSLVQPTAVASITPKPLTVEGITAADKVYDGGTNATLNLDNAELVGVIGSEDVTLDTNSATGVFDSAAVGTDKLVTISGLTLDGADAGNYSLTQPSAVASTTPKPLPVEGITAEDKEYDGDTNAALNLDNAELVGVIGSDDVTLNTNAANGAFASADVGTNKAVTISGLTLEGVDAGNYSLVPPTAVASIAPKPLTVEGITAADKIYDGGTNATLNLDNAELIGVIGSEDVTLDTNAVTGAFETADVGTNKTVTISGLTLDGADAGNYRILEPTTMASITPAGVTMALVSSENPALPGAEVIFTATLEAVAPGAGVPTGSVQFKVDGADLGEPVTLTNGEATLSITNLPHGSLVISAEYAGDGNFLGVTNGLDPDQIINTPPVAGAHPLAATQNTPAELPLAELLTAVTDADDDETIVTSVSVTSTNGGSVMMTETNITYTPPTDFTGADSFTYTVEDPFGGSAMGTVIVTVAAAVDPPHRILSLQILADRNVKLSLEGGALHSYAIQATTNLTTPDWTTLVITNADINGLFEYVDLTATNYVHRFYRSATATSSEE